MWAGAAHAGAWPMEAGTGQAITTFTYDTADHAFDDNGEARLVADFEKIEASTFLEWGLTPHLTLVAQPVVQRVELRDSGGVLDEDTGFSASQIGLRWLLAQGGGGVVSTQFALVVPGEAENAIDKPLGAGGLATEVRVLLGRGWGDAYRGGFVDGQVGYRQRTDEGANEARFDATFGVRASRDWMFLGQTFSVWNIEGETALARDYRGHKAQLSVVRRLNPRWSVQLGGFGTYAGRDVVEERAAFASVWMRFAP